MKVNGHSISVGWAIAGFVLFVMSMLAFELQLQNEQNKADDAATFQIALHEWEDQTGRYRACVEQAELRMSQIDQWTSFYDAMVALYTNDPLVVAAFTDLRQAIPVHLPTFDVAECKQPGPRPEP